MKRRKLILSILAFLLCAAPASAQTHLSDPSLTTAKKTRVVRIYLYRQANENRPEIPGRLVAVRRRIFDYEPLYGAMQALVTGAVEGDSKYGKDVVVSPFYDVDLISARVKNQTAEISFTHRLDQEEAPRRWEEDLLYSHFTEAVTRTAREFKGVKNVSICVNGIKDYTNLNRATQTKCPFEPSPAPPPRPVEPGEMWKIEIELNKTDAPTTVDGTRRLTVPVKRLVRAADYINETYKLLIAGETAAEREIGYSTSTFGARFVSLRVKGAKAIVHFTMPPGAKFPAGDKDAPSALRSAAYSAVFQFFVFDKIEVCLDGVSNFVEVAEKGAPPRPCEESE
ncbi:MAG TPA: GerMN domain-containing protein [Pyrinomonadaceae bacterium]